MEFWPKVITTIILLFLAIGIKAQKSHFFSWSPGLGIDFYYKGQNKKVESLGATAGIDHNYRCSRLLSSFEVKGCGMISGRTFMAYTFFGEIRQVYKYGHLDLQLDL